MCISATWRKVPALNANAYPSKLAGMNEEPTCISSAESTVETGVAAEKSAMLLEAMDYTQHTPLTLIEGDVQLLDEDAHAERRRYLVKQDRAKYGLDHARVS